MLILLKISTLLIIFSNRNNLCTATPLSGTVEVATESDFPFIVSIANNAYIKEINPRGHYCGGALITRTHALTAAHCYFDNQSVKDYSVYVGSPNLNNNCAKYKIQLWVKYNKWAAHRQEDYHFEGNDIAIVQLVRGVPRDIPIPRIATSRPERFVHKIAITAGWGIFRMRSDSIQPYTNLKILRKADVRVISHTSCAKKIHRKLPQFIHELNIICTNGAKQYTNALLFAILDPGDSGSPLLVRQSNGDYEIIGVNEGLVPKARDLHEILDEQNTHVSVYYYLSFIKSVAHLIYLYDSCV